MQGECKRKKRDRLGGRTEALPVALLPHFFRPRVPRSEVSPPVASAEEREQTLYFYPASLQLAYYALRLWNGLEKQNLVTHQRVKLMLMNTTVRLRKFAPYFSENFKMCYC